jgi:hypothetical protein
MAFKPKVPKKCQKKGEFWPKIHDSRFQNPLPLPQMPQLPANTPRNRPPSAQSALRARAKTNSDFLAGGRGLLEALVGLPVP